MQEFRIKSLTDEVTALRKALAEREDSISKMRVEIHERDTKVIDYKVWVEHILVHIYEYSPEHKPILASSPLHLIQKSYIL